MGVGRGGEEGKKRVAPAWRFGRGVLVSFFSHLNDGPLNFADFVIYGFGGRCWGCAH